MYKPVGSKWTNGWFTMNSKSWRTGVTFIDKKINTGRTQAPQIAIFNGNRKTSRHEVLCSLLLRYIWVSKGIRWPLSESHKCCSFYKTDSTGRISPMPVHFLPVRCDLCTSAWCCWLLFCRTGMVLRLGVRMKSDSQVFCMTFHQTTNHSFQNKEEHFTKSSFSAQLHSLDSNYWGEGVGR